MNYCSEKRENLRMQFSSRIKSLSKYWNFPIVFPTFTMKLTSKEEEEKNDSKEILLVEFSLKQFCIDNH
ncbi:hypothetical protein DERP_011003 [Dermatophagoides pteronyssinus]|uniref:Uncharacterized protein n=1 Tax=Dermatophagoides pteronyssinus TaxID=6956 RepID=A0ABQ8JV22_DERPT|nr:hypothetical protein DERP_011003 [Dermatophagoides pteronyssinus]